ncbi:MAG: biotin--[acetyl-CoA-carboxylase] ligase [Acidobacteriota bacterium]|nr:biotin--[acetyl-CoA-carboxylase] ligase [Acidobacteriota bacterium]
MSGDGRGDVGSLLPSDLRFAMAELAARRPELGLDLRWADVLPSTMDVVAAAAERQAPAGLVVGAESQTAGRGRRGRAWISPPGAGLYFSYLARPTRDVGLVTLAAGVAVREAVARGTGLTADLKWPNDLLVGARKLAGVLADGARVGGPDVAVTIGVGINVRPAALPPDVAERATCLEVELGRAVDRGHLLASVVERLSDALAVLSAGGADGILQAWRAASPSAVGTRVEWAEGSATQAGVTVGIDEAGALLVQTPTGLERIIAGELRWSLVPGS